MQISKNRAMFTFELLLLLSVPVALVAAALVAPQASAGTTLVLCCVVLLLMFAGFERTRPPLRQLMPTVMLASLAAAGRILFALVPDVKPVSAITIIAGASLGRREGFVVGALAALLSNMFFGQGPWTPWQMYAWGCMGYAAGVLASRGCLQATWMRATFGFVSCLAFGLVMNAYYIVGFVHPITPATICAALLGSLALDTLHGVATVVFLGLLYTPWQHKLAHFAQRYGL